MGAELRTQPYPSDREHGERHKDACIGRLFCSWRERLTTQDSIFQALNEKDFSVRAES